jgi:hypothetical protein
MTSGFFIGQQDLDKIITSLTDTLRAELNKTRSEVENGPMTAKETAKYLKCGVSHVYKKWVHLRHMVDGTPYWFKNEIDEFIKKQ